MIGRNVQAYVDDMVVTSQVKDQHVTDLEELFTMITKYTEAKPREVCCNPRNEEPDLSEGGAAVDRADNRSV